MTLRRALAATFLVAAAPPVWMHALPPLDPVVEERLRAAAWLVWLVALFAAYVVAFRGRWHGAVLGGLVLALAVAGVQLVGSFLLERGRARHVRVENLEFHYETDLNARGFREAPLRRRKPPGTRRVLFVGDSFVYGAAVPDEATLPVLLEARLDALGEARSGATEDATEGATEGATEDATQDWEVWNLGVNAANTFGYLQILRDTRVHEADFVLLGFYVDNDFSLVRKTPRRGPLREAWHRVQRPLRRLLRPAAAGADRDCIFPWVRSHDADPYYLDRACEGAINPWLLRRATEGEDAHAYYEALARRFREEPVLRENLEAARRVRPDVPFAVVIFPSKYQVSAGYFGELERLGFRFGSEEPVGDAPQRALAGFLEARDIPYLDLLPVFRRSRRETERRHYYAIDDHFNPHGSRVAAEAIADWMAGHPEWVAPRGEWRESRHRGNRAGLR